MECNIGQDAIFLTNSEMLYFLGRLVKYRQKLHFYNILQKNLHALFDTIL
jgi:sorbitol-specific phosphotransferase system component IIC